MRFPYLLTGVLRDGSSVVFAADKMLVIATRTGEAP